MYNSDADELSSSQYATHRKELLLLVKQLRAMGAQADIDLPRVTVIGNQSAGKSSVVEAISGITVPRDAGTCTRCPMECRLSSSENEWSCKVSIRWEFQDNGNREDEVSESPFGGTITEKSEVELMLRRAQAAVLNPHVAATEFLDMDEETLKSGSHGSERSLQFSRNVVCVDLEGPGLTDLSFIDLPGIIQNAEDDIVKLVENLVVSHIQGNCLILVALPMTDDIENQRALRLARQEDPQGRRTIGVLTKPDALGPGATSSRRLWLDVIEGRRQPLLHGYYCTRNPDDDERLGGLSPAEARALEAKYFSNTAPWSESVHRKRFGTNNLVSSLSTLLVQVIKETLPHLRAETISSLKLCNTELSSLPLPISEDPVTYMLSLISSFSVDIGRYVQGARSAERLVHENKKAYGVFDKAIRMTAPKFKPYISAHYDLAEDRCFSSSDHEDEDHEDDEEDSDEYSDDGSSQTFDLSDMRQHIEKSVTRELPDNIPFGATVALITSFQSTWQHSSDVCFDTVRACVLDVLRECVENTFKRHEHLQSIINTSLSNLVTRHYNMCLGHVKAILDVELSPFTQNRHYLQTSKSKWLSRYKKSREDQADVSPQDPDTVKEALRILARLGHVNLSPNDLEKLKPADEYDRELQAMAEVRGYFKVACKRVIDNVPSLIDLKFVRAIPEEVQKYLISELNLGATDAHNRCLKYLAEDPGMVARRDELTARKKRLEGVQQELHSFGL